MKERKEEGEGGKAERGEKGGTEEGTSRREGGGWKGREASSHPQWW